MIRPKRNAVNVSIGRFRMPHRSQLSAQPHIERPKCWPDKVRASNANRGAGAGSSVYVQGNALPAPFFLHQGAAKRLNQVYLDEGC